MDARPPYLKANADTIYFWINLDVTARPIVVETPLLVVDDVWFNWITDCGLPGPDRGAGSTCSYPRARR